MFKQTRQELDDNKIKVDKAFLPAVLGLKAWASILPSMGIWLNNNCSFNGVVDASVPNMIRAINSLDGTGLFDWEIAPIKKPAKKRPDFLQTNDGSRQKQKDAESELDIQMRQERERRVALGNAANAELMSEAAAIVRNHSSISHSRTAREKAVLKVEFDRLVAAKVHPKDVLAGVKAKQDTFANGDVTRPTFGGR
jgi:hypothetical protein